MPHQWELRRSKPKQLTDEDQADEQKSNLDGYKNPNLKIPVNYSELNELIIRANFYGEMIHDMIQETMFSGSKVSDLHSIRACLDTVSRVWGLAKKIVGKSAEFMNLIIIVRENIEVNTLNERSEIWPGAFKPIRELREQIIGIGGIRTHPQEHRDEEQSAESEARQRIGTDRKAARQPRRRPAKRKRQEMSNSSEASEYPPDAEDESPVNAALILFLQSLTSLVEEAEVQWVLNHFEFNPAFKSAAFTTMTDGGLRHITTHKINAIVEAKKMVKAKARVAIQKQETAEMVGWLPEDSTHRPQFNGYRPLFAGDRDELYVQFTTWGEDYGRYLGEGLVTEEPCMVTEGCGPFRIGRADDLQIFATIIVAMTLVLKGF